jgi:3',5'-cyclic AMP phosphodiesterase CpdA
MHIAHFSDLHVLALDGVSPLRFLNKRFTGYANLRLKRKHVHRSEYVRAIAREIARTKVDHVVITGDLTNLALESEFRAVHEILENDLGLDPKDVSIIPGNHDLYTRGAESSKRFTHFFGAYVTSDLPELAVDVGVGHFPFVRLRGPAAIIGMSSAIPRAPFVAAGRIGKKQFAALDKILAHPEVKRRTPILLLHHPAHNPTSRIARMMRGLDDAALLWTSVGDTPRGMILHGHLHTRIHQKLTTSQGSIDVIGATSASLDHESPEKMAGFNVYDVTRDGAIGNVVAHVFDPRDRSFHQTTVPIAS